MAFIFWFEQLLFSKVGFTTSATKAVIDSFINLDYDLSEVVENFGTDETSVRIWKTP